MQILLFRIVSQQLLQKVSLTQSCAQLSNYFLIIIDLYVLHMQQLSARQLCASHIFSSTHISVYSQVCISITKMAIKKLRICTMIVLRLLNFLLSSLLWSDGWWCFMPKSLEVKDHGFGCVQVTYKSIRINKRWAFWQKISIVFSILIISVSSL